MTESPSDAALAGAAPSVKEQAITLLKTVINAAAGIRVALALELLPHSDQVLRKVARTTPEAAKHIAESGAVLGTYAGNLRSLATVLEQGHARLIAATTLSRAERRRSARRAAKTETPDV